MYSVLLFLAFAAVAFVLLPVTKTIRRGPKRFVSKRKVLAILWSRWLVGSLCFGAFLGFVLGALGHSILLVGTIGTLGLLVPASMYFGVLWLQTLSLGSPRHGFMVATERERPSQSNHSQGRGRQRRSERVQAKASRTSSTFSPAVFEQAGHPGANVETAAHALTGSKAGLTAVARDQHRALTQAEELPQLLATIDDRVGTVTLDDSPSHLSLVRTEATLGKVDQALIVSNQAEGPHVESAEQRLAALGADQMRSMVVNLRKEKHNLLKLVLAQKASLDSEREVHNRTLEYAKATAEQLRGSLLKQQRVTKVARRERAQRIKLEHRLDSANRALRNLQSVRKHESDAVEAMEA